MQTFVTVKRCYLNFVTKSDAVYIPYFCFFNDTSQCSVKNECLLVRNSIYVASLEASHSVSLALERCFVAFYATHALHSGVYSPSRPGDRRVRAGRTAKRHSAHLHGVTLLAEAGAKGTDRRATARRFCTRTHSCCCAPGFPLSWS